jgi:hypothetical protein
MKITFESLLLNAAANNSSNTALEEFGERFLNLTPAELAELAYEAYQKADKKRWEMNRLAKRFDDREFIHKEEKEARDFVLREMQVNVDVQDAIEFFYPTVGERRTTRKRPMSMALAKAIASGQY